MRSHLQPAMLAKVTNLILSCLPMSGQHPPIYCCTSCVAERQHDLVNALAQGRYEVLNVRLNETLLFRHQPGSRSRLAYQVKQVISGNSRSKTMLAARARMAADAEASYTRTVHRITSCKRVELFYAQVHRSTSCLLIVAGAYIPAAKLY